MPSPVPGFGTTDHWAESLFTGSEADEKPRVTLNVQPDSVFPVGACGAMLRNISCFHKAYFLTSFFCSE